MDADRVGWGGGVSQCKGQSGGQTGVQYIDLHSHYPG